jgi:hypothetical protein
MIEDSFQVLRCRHSLGVSEVSHGLYIAVTLHPAPTTHKLMVTKYEVT